MENIVTKAVRRSPRGTSECIQQLFQWNKPHCPWDVGKKGQIYENIDNLKVHQRSKASRMYKM